jgi:transcriptional regulator with XRE-family HTH domain
MINVDEGPYMRRVGKFLRDIRESKGLTQAQMAEILGISNSAVSKLERGIVNISVFKVVAYASLIKIKVSDFFKCVEGREAFEKAERSGGNWERETG